MGKKKWIDNGAIQIVCLTFQIQQWIKTKEILSTYTCLLKLQFFFYLRISQTYRNTSQ